MATYFTDQFDRADNADLGADWDAGYTPENALKIASGAALEITLGTNSTETFNTIALPDNQFAGAVMKAMTGASEVYLCVLLRAASPATRTYYQFCAQRNSGGTTSSINKVSAGTSTGLITESATTWAAGDTMRAEVTGTALRLYRNAGLLLSTTDGGISSGSRAGLTIYIAASFPGTGFLTDAQFENFSAGDYFPDMVPMIGAQQMGSAMIGLKYV